MGPNTSSYYPIQGYNGLVFLKNIIQSSNIFVGDYSYFDDRINGPGGFEERNVLYNYHPDRVKLVIGKFCAIAAETKFIMTGDHKLDGVSTYPFPVFKNGWENAYDIGNLPIKGDIIIGNDVWFGYGSLVLNGVIIGDGAIIAAGSVVVKDVPPYSVVAGNPAKVVKKRFDDKTVSRLLSIAWWNWDAEKISKNIKLISSADIDMLEEANRQ